MPSRKRALRVLLVVGSLLVGLLLCEIGLRIVGFSYPRFSMPDRYRGNALRPNAEGWWREEGSAYIKINSAGLRDREHAKIKPPNTFRIAVLGDSYAEALQVAMNETFWALMEQRLQECRVLAGKQIEVINFGVSGYGTAQELITLRRDAWNYSPDLVLLAVTTGNDLRDNSPLLSQDGARPFFVYRGDQLVLDDSMLVARDNSLSFRILQSAPIRALDWLGQHSRLLQLINRARVLVGDYRIRRKRERVASSMPKGADVPELREPGIDYAIYDEPVNPAWRDAWRMTEGTIKLMHDEVAAKNSRFFVVTLSNSVQVTPDSSIRDQFLQRMGIRDPFYPDRRIEALGRREGFPVLNLAPILQAYAKQHNVFLHGFGDRLGVGHWNQEGHRQAGEIISAWLCESLTAGK